ncbi:uncharacterized protein LOC141592188 [Silene latifolia]|uniref:uncharacterized protein LOC141592188 n=1 Tax=Silene latifolia TaxID=37657 RepID=UPI003D784A43
MAPRRRPRKVGLMRMDAAIDALKPMGYSPDFVRRKVKELLAVYGGDEGWPFIEGAGYKSLIEYILDDGNEDGQCEQGEPSAKNDDKDQDTAEEEPSQAEPSSETFEPLYSSQDTLLLSPDTVLTPLTPLKVRKPCFGWIGPKDEDDYVLLKPAPVQGWKSGEWRKKRKSRWDVGPNDVV